MSIAPTTSACRGAADGARRNSRGAPELAVPLEIVAAAIAFDEPAVRLQQVCGAVTAKSIEDCLFYRDARLVSLQEVGGDRRASGSAPPNSINARPTGPGCGRRR